MLFRGWSRKDGFEQAHCTWGSLLDEWSGGVCWCRVMGKGALSWSPALAVMANGLASADENGLVAEWVSLSHPKNLLGGIRTFLCTWNNDSFPGSYLNLRRLSSSKLCPLFATDDRASCALLPCLVQPEFSLSNTSFIVIGVYPLVVGFVNA